MILYMGLVKILEKVLKLKALSSNSSVITCLANDIGYENIYSEQIRVKRKGRCINCIIREW